MLDVKLRPLAISDLEEIWEYTVNFWDIEQAETYLQNIQKAFEKLAENPSVGRSYERVRVGYWKFAVGKHLIFYRTDATTLEVVRVLHERMDVPTKLEEL